MGALLGAPYRFRARPWDLREVASTCPHCSAGDSISVQVSQNEVLRLLGVDNPHTNQSWLSDKCRFGYEFVNSAERLAAPLVRGSDGELREATWVEALDIVADRLGGILREHGGGAVAGLGGARGTNEDAYAFSKFMRTVVGSNHVDARMDDAPASQFLAAVVDRARIDDIDSAATIVVWGPDLKKSTPPSTRECGPPPPADLNQSSNSDGLKIRRPGARLIVMHPRRTGLDDVARQCPIPARSGRRASPRCRPRRPEIDEALAAVPSSPSWVGRA